MAGGARCSSLLRGFLSLFFVMFLHIGHAGCCFSQQHGEDYADGKDSGAGSSSKRRKISPLTFSPAASSSIVVEERARARRRHVSSLATNLRCYLHRIFSSSGAKNAVPAAEHEEAVTTAVSSPLAQSVTQRQASVVLSTPSSPCASPFLSPMSPRSLTLRESPILLTAGCYADGHKSGPSAHTYSADGQKTTVGTTTSSA